MAEKEMDMVVNRFLGL